MVAQPQDYFRSRERHDELLAAALEYARRGWHVFPLHSPSAPGREAPCDCGRGDCASPAKKPWTEHGLDDATRDEEQIRAWWRRRPFANIGIATGQSRLCVLDVDPRHDGIHSLIELVRRHGLAPGERTLTPAMERLTQTLMVETGGGGQHYYWRSSEARDGSLRNRTDLDGLPGLDVRAYQGYVVAAPSQHINGALYEWHDGDAWRELAIATLPTWLGAVIRRPAPQSAPSATAHARRLQPGAQPVTQPVTDGSLDERPGGYWLERALDGVREGGRNSRGFWLACQLRDDGVSQDDAEALMVEFADRAPGGATLYRTSEALQSLRSAYRAAPREPAVSEARRMGIVTPLRRRDEQPEEFGELDEDTDEPDQAPPEPAPAAIEHLTDLGNARRFVKCFGRDARYVSKWQQWLLWDGTRFLSDETEQAMRWAKATAKRIRDELELSDDADERELLSKWATRSEGETRLRAMLSLAQSEPEINVGAERLDADPWLLNCRNGSVDLRVDGERRFTPHDRQRLCTKRAEADYDAGALCPTWLSFLHTTFAGDDELIAYIQRAVGYSLTGDTSEQCLFVLHGTGSNGKSTFIETLTTILADYGSTTPMDTLMAKRGEVIPSDIARLVGARFVAASESGEGRRLDEELVKRITGGDRMTARFMHHDWFQFIPVLKLWLAVNAEPQIRGTDHGIWRRVHLVPFKVTISDDEQDKRLKAKLLAERSGIIAWAVAGCIAWQRGGLRPPEKVLQATREYRSRMDNIGRFIEEMTVQRPTATAGAKRLHTAYEAWCEDIGESKASATRFGRYLGDHGYNREHTMAGALWIGLELKAPRDEPPPDPSGLFG